MCSANIKSEVINNILLQMLDYVDNNTIDILQKVIEEQLVFINMEEISTLPATIKTSVDEQNYYIIQLLKLKKKNLCPETIKQYQDAAKRLVSVIQKPLNKIDEIDIEYYMHWYEDRNLSSGKEKNKASTCNSERRFLSAFFTWMRKEKFITYNPVELTEPYKEVRKPIDYFSVSQMENLREGCQSLRDRAIVEVLRSTGARVGEIPQINKQDINWNTGDVTIISEKSGKYRTILIDEVAMFHLSKYIKTRKDENDALFVWDKKPYSRLNKAGIRSAIKKIASRENMECRVYPHKFRKTLGMHLKNREVDIGIIQEVMGHANPTVTSRYYAESTPDTLRSIRKRVGA